MAAYERVQPKGQLLQEEAHAITGPLRPYIFAETGEDTISVVVLLYGLIL